MKKALLSLINVTYVGQVVVVLDDEDKLDMFASDEFKDERW